MTKLFEESERTELRPAERREQSHAYLNISARQPAALIRKTLNGWFAAYPEEHKDSLKQDFTVKADQSAFTELLIYTTLSQLGAKDILVHPELAGTNRRPDFRATLNAEHTYIEVKNAAEMENPRVEDFCDQVNKSFTTTGFMIDLSFEGTFAKSISVSKFCTFLDHQTNHQDIYELRRVAKEDGADKLPIWTFNHADGRIHITPIPTKHPDKVYQRPIGSQSPHDVYLIENAKTLRKSLKKKASRYGELDSPFIIVVNFEDGFIDDIDIAEALFGDEELVFRGAGRGPEINRKPNGLWSKSRNTRVSGVLILDRTNPWSFWQRVPSLWLNPWATYPLDGSFFDHHMQTHKPDMATGKIVKTEGTPFLEILGLSKQQWQDAFNH
ncbi:hypothetical protein QMT40_002844 [Parvibaculaceae bacterium PLY_AMNH_Bact1]|nr:hypothetical protein QMT40_002844 [Parvibaculaceae bacterium PLY_AMNH_Bact1]